MTAPADPQPRQASTPSRRDRCRSLWDRRTHRVSRGSSIAAGSMSYASSEPRAPLNELEEAMLIAVTGCTGLTMPDRPFSDPRNGQPIMAKPNLNMIGRTAGSPDNAQGTHFFMINDSRHLLPAQAAATHRPADRCLRPDHLLERAAEAKVKLSDRRMDVAEGNRDFPAYLDSNRFLSNQPGTTILFPVVELSRQYINGDHVPAHPAGGRAADDRRRPQPLPHGGCEEVGAERLPEQGHQAAARKPRRDAHPDRGRPPAPEPDADRRLDGPRRVDPRHDRTTGPARRPEVPQDLRRHARLRLGRPAVEAGRRLALAGPAAHARRHPGQCRRSATSGRAPDQGHVSAQLRRP